MPRLMAAGKRTAVTMPAAEYKLTTAVSMRVHWQ
jgi:hypothetical protein